MKRLLPNKKGFFVLLVLLLSMTGVTNAFAQTFTQGNLNYSINSDGATVTVTGHVDGTSATGELVIPESVELYGTTYLVTVIGGSAFEGCSGLTGSLVIPNSVVSIGAYAFIDCNSFTNLTIGNAVQEINEYAFAQCMGFTGSLTIPNSVTTIGEGAFALCSGFTGSLTILDSVIWIGGSAFEGCYGFTGSLILGDAVQSIDNYAFYGCSGFTGDLTIGNSVQWIGEYAFYGCSGFTGLTLGDAVQWIDSNAFTGCIGFTGSLTIPENVDEIGPHAFAGCGFTNLNYNAINCWVPYTNTEDEHWLGSCYTLTSVNIGENVQVIPAYFLSGCSYFTGDLVIPNSVNIIGVNAFSGCTGFSGTLTIGNSVTQIDNTAFFGACQGFTSFDVLPETPPTLGNNVFVSADYGIPVAVPCGSLEAYQDAEGWNVFTNIQEQNPCLWMITAEVAPASGGSVSGMGIYAQGQTCTLVANPNEDFSFVNWTEDGVEVCTDTEYAFTVTESKHLVANFNRDNVIGEGTATNQYLPSYNEYYYSLTQQIYTADEIGQMGVIKSVSFFNEGYTRTRNYDIYLVHTEKTSFSSSNDWVSVTSADKVFTGNVTMASNDWTTITFDTPFAYNGTSNMVLVVDDNTGYYYSTNIMACRVFGTDGYQAIYGYSNSNFDPTNPSQYNGSRLTVKNQIALDFSSLSCAVFASVSPEGSGSVSGEGIYQVGETCTLTATPSSNDYVFVNWIENGEVVSTDAQYSFTVTNNRNLMANFLQFRVDIAVSTNPEEGGTVNGAGSYLLGQTCTLTASPNDGYAFVNWMENGQEVSTNASYSFTVTGSRTLVARFVDPVGTVQAVYYPDNANPGSPYVSVAWTGSEGPFEVIIGDETSTNNMENMPYTAYYKYSISEALFTAVELAQAGVTTGQMTSLSWEAVAVTTNQNQNNISIWMANVPDTELTTTSHQASNMTLVYTDNIGVPPLGWNEFVFNEGNFAWDGVSNVLILVQRNNGQWNGHVKWRSHDPGFYGMTYKYQDDTPYNAMTQTYAVTCVNTNRPNTLFKGVASENSDYYYNVYRTDCEGNNYSLIADSVSGLMYTDSLWLQQPLGSYQYGVSFIKDDGSESGIVASNCIERSLYTYQIAATPNLANRGTVSGAGEYALGANCTLTATPIGNNTFTCWKENGTVVSTEANYSFIVTEHRNLVAQFSVSPDDIIIFADNNVKIRCVNNWDIDGDGELAYDEAATVTNLGSVFRYNSWITSFEELQYFTGLTSIGQSAFRECASLVSIALPEGIITIGGYAFYECSSLTSLAIPDGVVSIGEYAFYDCYNLLSVNIPEAIVSIGEYAFYTCGLRGEITLPESLEYVGGYAFFGCDGITTVNYNAINCQTMGSAAKPVFYDCAFTHLNIGENVQSIPNFAFKRCFMVTDMNVAAVNPPTIYPGTFGMVSRSIPVSVPNGSGDAYGSAQYWEEFFNIIEIYFSDVQIVHLTQGYNWISLYVEVADPIAMLQMVETGLGGNGLVIKNSQTGTEYDEEWGWFGDLDEIGMTNEQMYKIQVSAPCTLNLEGTPANPASHPITIVPGWNWIGFPSTEAMSLDDAFAGFAQEGDKIRNSVTEIDYDPEWGWFGDFETLEPGQGYMYYSASNTPRTLVFPSAK